jgi:hypothetical protein
VAELAVTCLALAMLDAPSLIIRSGSAPGIAANQARPNHSFSVAMQQLRFSADIAWIQGFCAVHNNLFSQQKSEGIAQHLK